MESNPGLVTIGDPVDAGTERTVIVLGNARGGTSMIATALARLGVFVGDAAGAPLYEDARLVRAMTTNGAERVEDVIADYDRRHRVWGFKFPAFGQNPAIGEGLFRRPVYVAVFRDLLAVAQRRSIARGEPILDALAQASTNYGRIVEFLRSDGRSALLVSYEKALSQPEALVDAIVSVCALTVDEDTRANAITSVHRSPIGYQAKQSGRPPARGHLDEVSPAGIRGWATDALHAEPIEVTLHIDGAVVASMLADRHRADLARVVHPTGDCAYCFTGVPSTLLRPGAEVRVFASDGTELIGSPHVVPS